jgi:hypothetical protein
MNLEKLLELLFVFIGLSLRLLLGKYSGQCIRTMVLNPQIASA